MIGVSKRCLCEDGSCRVTVNKNNVIFTSTLGNKLVKPLLDRFCAGICLPEGDVHQIHCGWQNVQGPHWTRIVSMNQFRNGWRILISWYLQFVRIQFCFIVLENGQDCFTGLLKFKVLSRPYICLRQIELRIVINQ